MGVYNKAETMPTCCGVCSNKEFRQIEAEYFCIYTGCPIPDNGRHPNCPLIEVEVPHGDLIDRNELFKWYTKQRTKYPIKKETPQYETMMMYEVFDEIDDAEKIIEAEVE